MESRKNRTFPHCTCKQISKVHPTRSQSLGLPTEIREFSMNSTKSARTQLSPHKIIFGKPIACPSTALIDATEGDMTLDQHIEYTAHCLMNNIEQARLASQGYIRKMIKQTQERAKCNIEYQIQDQVWVFKPNMDKSMPKKLAKRYDGPYMIAERVKKDEYRLSRGLGQPKFKGTVAAQRLKPFFIKAEEPPMTDDEQLKSIKQTPEPNLVDTETELRDSVLDNEQVRNRDSDIEMYTPVEPPLQQRTRQSNPIDNELDSDSLFDTESEDNEPYPDEPPKMRLPPGPIRPYVPKSKRNRPEKTK